jgi:hypothetical protein
VERVFGEAPTVLEHLSEFSDLDSKRKTSDLDRNTKETRSTIFSLAYCYVMT